MNISAFLAMLGPRTGIADVRSVGFWTGCLWKSSTEDAEGVAGMTTLDTTEPLGADAAWMRAASRKMIARGVATVCACWPRGSLRGTRAWNRRCTRPSTSWSCAADQETGPDEARNSARRPLSRPAGRTW